MKEKKGLLNNYYSGLDKFMNYFIWPYGQDAR
jgi:hypothetical protein